MNTAMMAVYTNISNSDTIIMRNMMCNITTVL